MKYCILMGSPRSKGNTESLVKPFVKELEQLGHEWLQINLREKKIHGCIACRHCQKNWETFGCIHQDDVQEIFDAILDCDVIVLATPIYSWYCTAPMKALLDRLVYGMNKFYGESKGPSLWSGKQVLLITTCGYRPEKGADLWEEGMKRYCKHSELHYLGMWSERHLGYESSFMDDPKAERGREWARRLSFK